MRAYVQHDASLSELRKSIQDQRWLIWRERVQEP
jgi:hypothetical protein